VSEIVQLVVAEPADVETSSTLVGDGVNARVRIPVERLRCGRSRSPGKNRR